jgi:hypothetical protein
VSLYGDKRKGISGISPHTFGEMPGLCSGLRQKGSDSPLSESRPSQLARTPPLHGQKGRHGCRPSGQSRHDHARAPRESMTMEGLLSFAPPAAEQAGRCQEECHEAEAGRFRDNDEVIAITTVVENGIRVAILRESHAVRGV